MSSTPDHHLSLRRGWIVPILFAGVGWILAGIMPLVAGAFWPINAGQLVWHEHAVTFVSDPASPLPIAGREWVVQPWLTAIALFGTWKAGGIALLAALGMVVSAGVAAQLVRLSRAHARTSAALVAAGAALIMVMPLTVRCELGALLIAVTLRSELASERRWWWSAPLLMVLWSNVHGSFPVGLAMCIAAAVGMVRNAPAGTVPWMRRGAWLGVCAVATTVSPLGIGTWTYVDRVTSVPGLADITPLWQTMPIVSIHGMLVLASVGIVVGAALRSVRSHRSRVDGAANAAPAIPVLLLAGASFVAHRNIAWYAVMMVPELARALDSHWPSVMHRAVHVRRVGVAAFGVAIGAGCIALLPWLPLQHRFAVRSLPHDSALRQISASDTVYASAEWADYIRLTRGSRIVVDARLERFRPDDLRAYEQSVHDGVCAARTPCSSGWSIAALRMDSASRLVRRFNHAGCMVERVGSGSAQAAMIRSEGCAVVSEGASSP